MTPLEELLGGQNSMVWCLTIDGFIKFQLKRNMLNQDGKAAFLKQASKVLKEVPGLNNEKMDSISTASLVYAREEMQRNEVFTAFEEEARGIVYSDLVAAMQTLHEQVGSVDGKVEKAEAGG